MMITPLQAGVAALLLATSLVASAADEMPDDSALQSRISAAFEASEDFADSLVEVHSHRGFILLLGQVGTAELKSQATNTVVFASSAIRRIINELQVVSTIDANSQEADATLSTAVMSDIAAMDPALAERIQAPVHKGVVYLMGALTRTEVAAVTERVSFMPGVASIRTAFEFLPSD